VDSFAPGLLIAMPQMGDPNFERSVILLVEAGGDGAMGIVLNRPGPVTVEEIARAHGFPVPAGAGPVMVGGPVDRERGFLIHRLPAIAEAMDLADGVRLSVSKDSVEPILSERPGDWRFCLGYAGWGPGQLEQEVVAGAWLTAPLTARRVFDTPLEQIWSAVIRDLGVDPAFLVPGAGLH
jgi:putative transcriptional regulator